MPSTTRASARRKPPVIAANDESDYGSDIDDASILDMLEQSDPPLSQPVVLESLDNFNPLPQVARIPRIITHDLQAASHGGQESEHGSSVTGCDVDIRLHQAPVAIAYDTDTGIALNSRGQTHKDVSDQPLIEMPEGVANDTLSPLDRFRTRRRRPMSVTDIVSPSWCELQYFYSLAKYGKVQQTPAMRQGSAVHKVLEEEVHIAVPVEVMTREDGFGLRIWNIIQSLRTLRATGLTREFEVWGVLEGQVVNGVIDELSHTCPDLELEAALRDPKRRGRPKKPQEPDAEQTTLDVFVGNPPSQQTPPSQRIVYITDIKTRANQKVPRDEVALRPTYLQLMLYRQLLHQMAAGVTPANQVFSRYHIDGDAVFSDVFISQIAGLDEATLTDPLSELLAHNTANRLWELMLQEFAATISSDPSPLLRVQYRAGASGDVLGEKVFLNDDRRLNKYVADEMAWWKGERPARGVDIEEAFKCRICSFADDCSWRQEKVDERRRKAAAKEAESQV